MNAPEGSPHAALLTGERGIGKTTFCLKLARTSASFSGIVSPAVLDPEGRRIGFQALSLESGESWELARSDRELDGPRFGRFSFSRAGIERSIGSLREGLSRAGKTLIIDEIGPLELVKGMGLAPVLPLLASAGNLLVVVRRELLHEVSALIPRHERKVFTITEESRDELLQSILEFLQKPRGASGS
jgi:nucleoside-triphosphatase THEP1